MEKFTASGHNDENRSTYHFISRLDRFMEVPSGATRQDELRGHSIFRGRKPLKPCARKQHPGNALVSKRCLFGTPGQLAELLCERKCWAGWVIG